MCLAFAWFIARLLYPKNSLTELSLWKINLLRSLRTFVIFAITVLLLSPVLKIKRVKTEIPLLFVLTDNSFSMKNVPDSAVVVGEIESLMELVSKELESSFKISWLNFDLDLKEGKELNFSGMHSGYSKALKQINSKYSYLSPSALLLIGDGLYNVGENPIGIAKDIEFPIITVPFGDTVPKTDLSILNVRSAPVVFKNSSFPVEVEIAGKELPSSEVFLKILLNDKELYNKNISINSKSFYSSENFLLEVPEAGVLNYKFSISAVDGETNLSNNTKTITVEAVSNRQKVLILSDGPHPDIGALKSALDLAGYETVLAVSGNFANYKPGDYSLIIFYQLPSKRNADIGRFINSKVPRWIFITGNTNLSDLNNYNSGIIIDKLYDQNVELSVIYNDNFDHFNIDEEFSDLVPELPPLFAPYGKYSYNNEMQILFKQKIEGVKTDYPAICIGVNNSVKTAITIGEGMWRWRIREAQAAGEPSGFNLLIKNISKYLALEYNQDNFNIDYSRVINSFDAVVFKAEVLNNIFEEVNNVEIALNIKNSAGDIYSYVFDEVESGYELNAGIFSGGEYFFSASVKTGSNSYSEEGSFIVVENNIEQLNTMANYKLLSQISDITGGNMFLNSERDEMIDAIRKLGKDNIREVVKEDILDLVHIKYIFLLLVLVAGSEWFLRRYWGTY
jgi:hypothetical protein